MKIAVIEHEQLMDALRLDTRRAKALDALKNRVPRSLNAQCRLTWTDIEDASSFVVSLVEGG